MVSLSILVLHVIIAPSKSISISLPPFRQAEPTPILQPLQMISNASQKSKPFRQRTHFFNNSSVAGVSSAAARQPIYPWPGASILILNVGRSARFGIGAFIEIILIQTCMQQNGIYLGHSISQASSCQCQNLGCLTTCPSSSMHARWSRRFRVLL